MVEAIDLFVNLDLDGLGFSPNARRNKSSSRFPPFREHSADFLTHGLGQPLGWAPASPAHSPVFLADGFGRLLDWPPTLEPALPRFIIDEPSLAVSWRGCLCFA